jgi:hypothetical protein
VRLVPDSVDPTSSSAPIGHFRNQGNGPIGGLGAVAQGDGCSSALGGATFSADSATNRAAVEGVWDVPTDVANAASSTGHGGGGGPTTCVVAAVVESVAAAGAAVGAAGAAGASSALGGGAAAGEER